MQVTQVFPAAPGEVRNASYSHVHAAQPQTLAHALADSPVGLLAWNSQAMADLDPDALLTHVTIHWLTGTAGSAPRIYAEEDRQQPPNGPATIPPGLTVPLGLAQCPNDWPSDRAWPSVKAPTSCPGTSMAAAATMPPAKRRTCWSKICASSSPVCRHVSDRANTTAALPTWGALTFASWAQDVTTPPTSEAATDRRAEALGWCGA